MQSLNYGRDYKYPHSHPEHFIDENYFPEGQEETFYHPTELGREAWIKNRLKSLWKKRYRNS
jgi:putative ATPase